MVQCFRQESFPTVDMRDGIQDLLSTPAVNYCFEYPCDLLHLCFRGVCFHTGMCLLYLIKMIKPIKIVISIMREPFLFKKIILLNKGEHRGHIKIGLLVPFL